MLAEMGNELAGKFDTRACVTVTGSYAGEASVYARDRKTRWFTWRGAASSEPSRNLRKSRHARVYQLKSARVAA